jgi:hypothetical protein
MTCAALHLKNMRAFGGTMYLRADFAGRQQGMLPTSFLGRGTWRLQQGIDIARQSAVPPNRCVNGVPSRISCGASCPDLISAAAIRPRSTIQPVATSEGSPRTARTQCGVKRGVGAPGRVKRAYHTSGHLPVAVVQACVLTRPTIGVGTSAHAICGLIFTSRGCHCFSR